MLMVMSFDRRANALNNIAYESSHGKDPERIKMSELMTENGLIANLKLLITTPSADLLWKEIQKSINDSQNGNVNEPNLLVSNFQRITKKKNSGDYSTDHHLTLAIVHNGITDDDLSEHIGPNGRISDSSPSVGVGSDFNQGDSRVEIDSNPRDRPYEIGGVDSK
ncbi:MAG: hypothetical protein ABIP78_07035 [Pyrinomonadaceae bacterium]